MLGQVVRDLVRVWTVGRLWVEYWSVVWLVLPIVAFLLVVCDMRRCHPACIGVVAMVVKLVVVVCSQVMALLILRIVALMYFVALVVAIAAGYIGDRVLA